MGISGALFRIYWLPEPAGGSDPQSICSGAPLARAAAAYQYEIDLNTGVLSDDRARQFETLSSRVDLFLDSLREGCRLASESSYEENGRTYASGRAAYDAMEATLRDAESGSFPADSQKSLAESARTIGRSRKLLARYLARVANFLGTAPGIGPLDREGIALISIATRLDACLSPGGADNLDERAMRAIARDLRKASSCYRDGIAAIGTTIERGRGA